MAITQTQILNLCVSMFNAAPGATNLAALEAWATANPTATTADMAVALGLLPEFDAQFTGTDAETAAAMAANFGLTSGTGYDAAVAYFLQELTAGTSKAVMLGTANDFLLSADAATLTSFGLTDAKTVLENKTTVAEYYSVTKAVSGDTMADLVAVLAGVDATAASVTTAQTAVDVAALNIDGSTFSLTTATDSLVGTANNDLFEATSATLQAADRITDVSTTDEDVMNVVLTANPVAMDVTNVENINLDWDAYGTPTIDLDNVSGATVSLSSDKSGYLGSANFTNVGQNSITLGAGIVNDVTVDAIEDATLTNTLADTITVTTADGTINVVGGAATSIDIDGGDDVVVTGATGMDTFALGATTASRTADVTFSNDTTATIANATTTEVTMSATEAVTVTIAAGSTAMEALTLEDSNITLDFAAQDDMVGTEIINGGAITSSGATSTADFTTLSFTELTLADIDAVTATLTMNAGANIVLDDATDTKATALTFATTAADDTTADTLTLTVSDAAQGNLITQGGTGDFETVNIIAAGAAIADTTTINYDVTIDLVDAGTEKVVVTSATNDVEITAIDASEVDASGVMDDFLMAQSSDAEMQVIGGQGTNDITFAATTVNSTFVGSSTVDTDDDVTFITTSGEAVAVLNGGDNTVSATGTLTGSVTVLAGAGDDTVTANVATTGTVNVELGDGDNSLSATGITTATVVYEGGSGDDTLTVGTIATIDAATITADLGDGDNTATIELDTGTSVTTVSLTMGSGDDTFSLTTTEAEDKITIALGAGTNTWNVADGDDYTAYDTLAITGLDVINIDDGSGTADVTFDADIANGQTLTVKSTNDDAANDDTVSFVQAAATTATTIDLSGVTLDRTVDHGMANTVLTVTTAAIDYTVTGSAFADDITTGTGDDTITGGAGQDTMDGGTGDNVYVIGNTDSSIAVANADIIAAFVTGADTLSLGVAGTSTNFVSLDGDDDANTATVYADALIAADAELNGTVLYAFVSDGATATQGWLFEDTDGDGDADQAIVLTGLADGDILYSDIVA